MRTTIAVLAAAALCGTCRTDAADLRFVLGGVVTQTGGVIPPSVSVGDRFVYWHVFDPEQADDEPGAGYGSYPNAIRSASLTFEHHDPILFQSGDIMVLNDAALGDSYRVTTAHPVASVSIVLADFESDQFLTDALPVTLDIGDFEMRQLNAQFEVGPAFWSVDGEFDTFTVEAVCGCDLDHDDVVDVTDLLAYLGLWFADAPAADIDGTAGVGVSDVLEYLACWFPASGGSPCP